EEGASRTEIRDYDEVEDEDEDDEGDGVVEAEVADEDDADAEADDLVTIPDHLRGGRRRPVEPEPEREAPARLSPMAIAAARRRRELAEQDAGDLVGATAAALTPENANALVRELAELGSNGRQAAEVIEAASRATTPEE